LEVGEGEGPPNQSCPGAPSAAWCQWVSDSWAGRITTHHHLIDSDSMCWWFI